MQHTKNKRLYFSAKPQKSVCVRYWNTFSELEQQTPPTSSFALFFLQLVCICLSEHNFSMPTVLRPTLPKASGLG
ncbi:hypothetical protein DWUX_2729 [Desulfovibrio diazotrophicus]|nr:hypothetical protein DWUX_2729 [Desulfovibrio diazotrophicus]